MKLSLGRKIVILLIALAILLNGTSLLVSRYIIHSLTDEEYSNDADCAAATVAVTIDGDRMQAIAEKVMERYDASVQHISNEEQDDPNFEAYMSQYLDLMEDEDYIEIRNELRRIQDVNDVDCVYTLFPVQTEAILVYIVDGAYEEICTPGTFDFTEPECLPYLRDLELGFPAFISNTPEYGWMVTACAPIHNSVGDVVCFAAVDIDMNEVRAKERGFLLNLVALLVILTILLCIAAILYVKLRIVKPINMLSEAAGQYSHKEFGGSHHEFGSLNIHTGDELEILLGSMIQMEQDIDSYIDSLTQTKELLSTARRQADDMHELAHMDALTGIRNKLAYDKEIDRLDDEIADGQRDIGIAMIDLNFLKVTNDTYGHEAGNAAIQALSRLICHVFVHSPVFRIGGDEFAVILRNHDFNEIETLVREFNSRLEQFKTDNTLQPWEKISASLGYALFDPKRDRYAHDVFKRADQNMYLRKKAMKAMRE